MFGFIVGFFVGGFLGVLAMSLCLISKDRRAEKDSEEDYL